MVPIKTGYYNPIKRGSQIGHNVLYLDGDKSTTGKI